MILQATNDAHKKAAELQGLSMLQVTDEKNEPKAIEENEKDKNSVEADVKPAEAPKAEPKKIDAPKMKTEEQIQADKAVR